MPNNEKREKFEDDAIARTTKIVDAIRILGKLANNQSYDYTQAHVNRMFATIRDKLDATEAQFRGEASPVLSFDDLREPATAATPLPTTADPVPETPTTANDIGKSIPV